MVQVLEKPFDGPMLLEAVLGTLAESSLEELSYTPVGLCGV
jgi:hypothetical protein